MRTSPDNFRYFVNGSGRAVLLVGSHTWTNFQDHGGTFPPSTFDFEDYLEFLQAHNHNFFRMWCQEQACWTHLSANKLYWYPLPYLRTGPGKATDEEPKFDLEQFNPTFFQRLKTRVAQAQNRGIYVSVMLFNGWSVAAEKGRFRSGNPWLGHPFHRDNNINNVDGDADGDGSGTETHELRIPAITKLQEAYVRKVIDTVNDFDNVLYEISNESHASSEQWQYHMIQFIKRYESDMPKQHPVGMSVEWPSGSNRELLDSPADWISPKEDDASFSELVNKVVIDDTDHWFGIGGDRHWAWQRFLHGGNPIFMDPYDASAYLGTSGIGGEGFDTYSQRWTSLRRNLGYIRALAEHLDLASCIPCPEMSTSGSCLACTKGDEQDFVVFVPKGTTVSLDLSGEVERYVQTWLDLGLGVIVRGTCSMTFDAPVVFESPFSDDSVLWLSTGPNPS